MAIVPGVVCVKKGRWLLTEWGNFCSYDCLYIHRCRFKIFHAPSQYKERSIHLTPNYWTFFSKKRTFQKYTKYIISKDNVFGPFLLWISKILHFVRIYKVFRI